MKRLQHITPLLVSQEILNPQRNLRFNSFMYMTNAVAVGKSWSRQKLKSSGTDPEDGAARSSKMLYVFFWVIPRRLNFICRHFGTLSLFHLHRQVGVEWLNLRTVELPRRKHTEHGKSLKSRILKDVSIYQSTRCNNPEDLNLDKHSCMPRMLHNRVDPWYFRCCTMHNIANTIHKFIFKSCRILWYLFLHKNIYLPSHSINKLNKLTFIRQRCFYVAAL